MQPEFFLMIFTLVLPGWAFPSIELMINIESIYIYSPATGYSIYLNKCVCVHIEKKDLVDR